MERLSQATEVLRAAEGQIRELLLIAAREGAYEDVAVLADWAQHLRRLTRQSSVPDGIQKRVTDFTELDDSAHQKQRLRPKPTKGKKSDYPKFYRVRDELVKVGWSKKQKSEYRHKISKQFVLLVALALQARASDGEQFAFEELLPILDPQSKSEVPSYQAYLALAWLRKENLITRHGRQGYSLSPNVVLADAIEERWKLLPKS